jgi:hypothetical protein
MKTAHRPSSVIKLSQAVIREPPKQQCYFTMTSDFGVPIAIFFSPTYSRCLELVKKTQKPLCLLTEKVERVIYVKNAACKVKMHTFF